MSLPVVRWVAPYSFLSAFQTFAEISFVQVEKDEEDSSVTRPPELLRTIFGRANLSIFKEFKQNKFPKDLFDVHMFALRSKDKASNKDDEERLAKLMEKEREAQEKMEKEMPS